MGDSGPTVSSILGEFSRRSAGDSEPHLPFEELEGYVENRLAPAVETRVRSHLLVCPSCARLVLDLAEATEIPLRRPDQALSPAEAAADREHFAASGTTVSPDKLDSPEVDPAATPPDLATKEPFTRGQVSRGIPWRELAAVLAFACAGLGLWVDSLRRSLDQLSGPVANIFAIDLEPGPKGIRRDQGTSSRGIEIPENIDRVVLLLNQGKVLDGENFEVVISSSDGETLWRIDGVVVLPDGNFSLEIPRELLSQSWYELSLYPIGEKERSPLAVYTLALRRGPS